MKKLCVFSLGDALIFIYSKVRKEPLVIDNKRENNFVDFEIQQEHVGRDSSLLTLVTKLSLIEVYL